MQKTIDEIYQEMLEEFSVRSGYRPNSACDLAARLYAAAAQIHGLNLQADWVLEQCFPQTAQGVYLDYHGETRGITRSAAVAATGVLRFSVDVAVNQDLPIEKGTVCLTASGIRFCTTEDGVLRTGTLSVDVPAAAVEPGENGNVAADTIVLMTVAPVGIRRCTNPEAFSGGSDPEGDESLRQRILDTYRRLPNGANAAYYEMTAMGYTGVAAAQAVGRPRGIGTVDVYIASTGGIPAPELVAAVQADLEEKREIAVDVQVLAPETAEVDLSLSLLPKTGATFEEAKAQADAAIRAHFTGSLLGKGVTLAELGHMLYELDSVANYHILAPAADVPDQVGTLPVLGSLSISQEEG